MKKIMELFSESSDLESQRLWLKITHWEYVLVINSICSQDFSIMLSGFVPNKSDINDSLPVDARIEIESVDDYQARDIPETYLGYIQLITSIDKPELNLILYSSQEASNYMQHILQNTSLEFGEIGLELLLKKPEGSSENFWIDEWKDESIPVTRYIFRVK